MRDPVTFPARATTPAYRVAKMPEWGGMRYDKYMNWWHWPYREPGQPPTLKVCPHMHHDWDRFIPGIPR